MNRIDHHRRGVLPLAISFVLTALLQVGIASPAAAATNYYVSPRGSDTNPGTASQPWRTLQRAADAAPTGAIVQVRAGTYGGFVVKRSGTSTSPITFQAYPGEVVTVAGSSTTADVIKVSRAHDIVIRGLRVTGAAASRGGAGIRIENASTRVLVEANTIYDNRSYGVSVVDSSYVTVYNNTISLNAEGVFVLRGGDGVRVTSNRIHHQDRMVVATQGGSDDHGGVGVSVVHSTGDVLVARNAIWGNRAVSPDWGYDGGATEIYASSNVTIEGNTMWDNRMVIETGSDGAACSNNIFRRNVAYGATTKDVSKGMVFRCAENMLVANNTFHQLDVFVFDLKQGGTAHATSIAGLRIMNNIAYQNTGKIYGIESALPTSVKIDFNLLWHRSGGTIASKVGSGSTSSMATWRSWGYDRTGAFADPRFLNPSTRDYRVTSASPARDHGTWAVGGFTAYPIVGPNPDIGRWEYGW
ncbi:MAG: right-handed parallel beta-helix repeat-containing protein [Chloroflexota bacterium]